jgi:hypothetical protein
MKADADKPRKGEQELALDEAGLEVARHNRKDGAMTLAYGPWCDDAVALLHSKRNPP